MIAVGVARAQRAWTRNDQHGHRWNDALGEVPCGQIPAHDRQTCDAEHDRDEYPGDLIRELLNRRFVGLRVRHHLDDLRQRRVLSDFRRQHSKRAGEIDGRGEDFLAFALVDRHAFAREHGFIDARLAAQNIAINGDLLAGLDQEHVADLYVVDRRFVLLFVPNEMGGLGAEVDEFLDRLARLAAASRLEVAPKKNKRGDHCAGFEVEVRLASDHRPQAEKQRGERP